MVNVGHAWNVDGGDIIQTDMDIFAKHVREIGHPITGNKFDAIGLILNCAIENLNDLTTRGKWNCDK